MEIVTKIDNKGRILIPRSIRKKMGIRGGVKVILRLKEDNIVEIIPIDKLYIEVAEIFRNKFKGWNEESHEATKIIESLVETDGDS
ncbi:MAG: AbrB/MazE/SpoVT family DNA-binding domain-containing protein [Candidatus Brockarchaeota archaeon]|nr:AbrB/MazE/SpoVT family DNA-binding domain-containing protein [Candidatus Brockarchaeota archaeon]